MNNKEKIALLDTDKKTLKAIHAVHKAFGAPGDYGYGTPKGDALNDLYASSGKLAKNINEAEKVKREDTSVKGSEEHKSCNHHHLLNDDQELVDFGTGEFVADNKRIPLLKALNDCGLVTRTHCYGHETGYSFVAILLENDLRAEVRKVNEKDAIRTKFNGKTELLLQWKRTD